MSWLSKATGISNKDLKHVVSTNVRGLGRTTEKLAPYASFIPGVGPIAAAGLAAAGSVAAGHNLKHTAGAALKTGIGGYAGQGLAKIGGAALSHIPGADKVTSALSHVPGLGHLADDGLTLPNGGPTPFAGLDMGSEIGSGINDVANAAISGAPAAASGGIGGMITGGLKSLGSYAKGHPDQILAAAQGVMGAMDAKKAGQLERDALNRSRAAYDAKAGLRKLSIDGITKAMQTPPDLSSTYPQFDPNLLTANLRRVS